MMTGLYPSPHPSRRMGEGVYPGRANTSCHTLDMAPSPLRGEGWGEGNGPKP